MKTSLRFGLYLGLAIGVGASIGTLSVQPIQFSLTLSCLVGTTVEAVAAAAVLHRAYRKEKS